MNLLLKAGLAIEQGKEHRKKEKQQLIKGRYLDNFASMYGLRRRRFESDAKLRERILQTISKHMIANSYIREEKTNERSNFDR